MSSLDSESHRLLLEAGLLEKDQNTENIDFPSTRQWLREAGLAEEDADRLAEDLAAVESPAWMENLSLQELYALAFDEEIGSEDDDSENED